MSVTQYIGARYVPLFADPIEWDNTRAYEPLTIVVHQGNSYTSRQAVPIGIDILNTEFWALTGNYNAQVEAYREEVDRFDGRITANTDAISQEEQVRIAADNAINSQIENIHNDISDMKELTNSLSNKALLKAGLSNPRFTPYTRYLFNDINNEIASCQACTFDENEDYLYMVTPLPGDQTTTRDSMLSVIDPRSGSLINRVNMPIGHGRTITTKGNLLLTSNMYDFNNNEWIVISIENKTNPIVVRTGNFYGRHLCWTDTGAAAYIGNKQIQLFDVEYDEQNIPTNFVPTEIITFDANIGNEQTLTYWNGFFLFASSLPEQISFIDAKTGESFAHIQLDTEYGFLRVAETESAFVINNHLYVTTNGQAPRQNENVVHHEGCVFRYDIFNPKGEFYDYWRKTSFQSTSGSSTNYISGQTPSFSSVSCDGSAQYPFMFIEDALNSWRVRHRLYGWATRQYSSKMQLNFTSETYGYIIGISNFIFSPININGVSSGSGKTATGKFEISGSGMVTLNRLLITESDHSGSLVGIFTENNDLRLTSRVAFVGQTDSSYDVFLTELSNVINESTEVARCRIESGSLLSTVGNPTASTTGGGYVRNI